MTYRGFLSRGTIGLRKPRSVSYNITPENGGVAGHYAGPAQRVNSHDDCLRLWRGYQNYHMDTHGWTDIAYTLGVCDHGYILAGRGAGVRTAANGTNTGNQHYYAVCWIGGQGETPTQDAQDAFWAAIEMLKTQGNAGNKVVRHSYFKPTSCPGNLGAVIDAGPQGGNMPTNTYDTGTGTLGVGDSGTYVSNLQRQLNDTGFDAGTVDGDFGPTTEGAVKRAQQKLGLTTDGLYGPNTRTALNAYTEELLAPEPEPTEPSSDWRFPHAANNLIVADIYSEKTAPGANVDTDNLSAYLNRLLTAAAGLVRVDRGSSVYHLVGEYMVPVTSPEQAKILVTVAGGNPADWNKYVANLTKAQAGEFTKLTAGELVGAKEHTHDEYAAKQHGHAYADKGHSHGVPEHDHEVPEHTHSAEDHSHNLTFTVD